MGCGFRCECDDDREMYDQNYPAVDADGYVEEWWKRAIDDLEESI